MTLYTDAIYEDGVLRPLAPLDLPEHEVVSLSIALPSAGAGNENAAERQRNILLEYVAKIESRPEAVSDDGFSNRDHDRLIYGD